MVCMNMDKKGACVLVLLLVWFSVSNGIKGDSDGEEQRKKAGLWQWQSLRNAYSVYEALLPTNIAYSFWFMLKDMFHQAHLHFFPPNIDFRRGEQDVTAGAGAGAGAGEVVSDAFAKSVGSSKATVENAAKSAAETVHNVVNKAASSHDTETKQRRNHNHNHNEL